MLSYMLPQISSLETCIYESDVNATCSVIDSTKKMKEKKGRKFKSLNNQ